MEGEEEVEVANVELAINSPLEGTLESSSRDGIAKLSLLLPLDVIYGSVHRGTKYEEKLTVAQRQSR